MFIELPNSHEKWPEISRKFKQSFNYPHALCTLDGKHKRIVKPNNGCSYFYNCKHTYSIMLLAIPEYECLNTDIGSNGRVNDSGIPNKCSPLQAIDDGSVKLPEDDYLINHCKLPYAFLGDDTFALKEFMMKPYPQENLTADKRIYNYYRHNRARRISELLFGMIRSPHSLNVCRLASLVDQVDENGNLTKGKRRKDKTGGYFLPIGNTQKWTQCKNLYKSDQKRT